VVLVLPCPEGAVRALITFVLFWIFGYWGTVGPLLSIVKVRAVFRTIEHARSREEIIKVLQSEEARAVAIDHIAAEYRIPRFLAKRVLKLVSDRIAADSTSQVSRPG